MPRATPSKARERLCGICSSPRRSRLAGIASIACDLRWEITNLTNTPNFTGLSTLVNSTTFGEVAGADMRTMDIVTRFTF